MRQVYNLAELSLGLATLPPEEYLQKLNPQKFMSKEIGPQDFLVEIEIMTNVKPQQVQHCFLQPLSRGRSPPDPAVEEDYDNDDEIVVI